MKPINHLQEVADGRGNHGHVGRPGKKGGSAPSGVSGNLGEKGAPILEDPNTWLSPEQKDLLSNPPDGWERIRSDRFGKGIRIFSGGAGEVQIYPALNAKMRWLHYMDGGGARADGVPQIDSGRFSQELKDFGDKYIMRFERSGYYGKRYSSFLAFKTYSKDSAFARAQKLIHQLETQKKNSQANRVNR